MVSNEHFILEPFVKAKQNYLLKAFIWYSIFFIISTAALENKENLQNIDQTRFFSHILNNSLSLHPKYIFSSFLLLHSWLII